ncbi:1-deoxy-D-xylulose-5-phosphate synthase [Nocardia sp. NPDC049220]|uniref:1-deoxy-D-xylulose-5-phosphate synthase n=1 Tax=Nocardia sp. NPDC049220 TaxID=3155273 RepID=UPI0033C7ADB3
MLARIADPRDLDGLQSAELEALAAELREFLVQKVAVHGGHLGPNLGVVELTIALHRVFTSPHDPIIFDTGHQSYVHKILTGRKELFDRLRTRGGLSGYPCRTESIHDWTESSHASAALSYADGLAKAFTLTGQSDRCVVAVVGDGALTGGMCWEALNNIAALKDHSIVLVVNDNGRSYAPTIGGLADRLTRLRIQPAYQRFSDAVKQLEQLPALDRPADSLLHAIKTGAGDAVNPQVLFSDLGIEYLGPVDGHDLEALESIFRRAREFGGPVVVHTVTRKGRGYPPADYSDDLMHSLGPYDPVTGRADSSSPGETWTSVFGTEMVRQGEQRNDIVAITAAMPGPTGLSAFAQRFPDRMFDVGIAEQHAVTSAAGLALGGLHPVVAIYSTFLNRAFDQVLMDAALLCLPVTLVLDRAGVTGPDGPSHHGVWDLSLLGIVPGIRVAAPRDAASLREQLAEALATKDGPTVLRFPKGRAVAEVPAVDRFDGVDVLFISDSGPAADVLVVAVGPMAAPAVEAAAILTRRGLEVKVIDPRWGLPVPDALIKFAGESRLVVTVEDGIEHGGISASVARRLAEADLDVRVRGIGVPMRFLEQGSREELLHDLGLDPTGIAQRISHWMTELDGRGVGREAEGQEW